MPDSDPVGDKPQLEEQLWKMRTTVLCRLALCLGLHVDKDRVQEWVRRYDDAEVWQRIEQSYGQKTVQETSTPKMNRARTVKRVGGILGIIVAASMLLVFLADYLRTRSEIFEALPHLRTRQTPVFRLIWRVYFTGVRANENGGFPSFLIPSSGELYLSAFAPHDELYREAYRDVRMQITLKATADHHYPFLSVELGRDHIESPFRRDTEGIASVVQQPSFGRYIANYWKLEKGTTVAELEKLQYSVSWSEEWRKRILKIVLFADDIPLAVFEREEEGKFLNMALAGCMVDPYNGEVKCRPSGWKEWFWRWG